MSQIKSTDFSLSGSKADKISGQTKPYAGYAFISEEMRQNYLVFLHDILNSAGGLYGFLELMKESDDPEKLKKYAENAFVLCDSLVEELHYQREFLLTESAQIEPVIEDTKISDVLEMTLLKIKSHRVAKDRNIEIADCPPGNIATDKVLLSRILVNIVKNAVEATDEGEAVRIGAIQFDDHIRFWVHNDSLVPEEVRDHLFATPSSTKGKNRGVGLFSVRLLGENALGGRVGYESTKERGTYFCIDLPLSPQ